MPHFVPLAAGRDAQLGEAARINLTWLIYLRWAAVLGQALTILYVAMPLSIELPLGWLAVVLGVEVLSNLGLSHWRRRQDAGRGFSTRTLEWIQVGVMFGDTLLLTVLLALTGGVANPFSAFFFVHVVMAAVLLRQHWAYMGAALACLCLVALQFVHQELPVLEARPDLRLQAEVAALSLAAVITAFFVARVTRSLDQRNAELASERERQARSERVEALGTLAAGAAHELASPLSTIAIVAKDLEQRLVREAAPENDLEDARLVREEVARCRRILDRMTLEAGEHAGQELVPIDIRGLFSMTVESMSGRERVAIHLAREAEGVTLFVPAEGLAQALRAVVSNALDASAPEQEVSMAALVQGDELWIVIEDRGVGMDAESALRAVDPFYTTKEPGSGMGLGLFLARSVVERLGGELALESQVGEGTRVRVRLPLARVTRPQ